MNTLGDRLKQLRGSTRQADLAAALGMAQTTLSNYETGRNEPSIEVLRTFVSHFSVNLRWLMFGEGPIREEDAEPKSAEPLSSGQAITQPREESFAKLERELELEREERRELATENRRLYREKEELLRKLGELSAKLALMEGRMEAARGETEQEKQPLRFDKKQAIPSSSHTLPTHK